MHKLISLAVALFLAAAPAAETIAQEAPSALTLEEALRLAREHNPEYRSQLNDEGVANWGVRSAYASFLPSASVSGGLSYQAGGQARIGGFTAGDIGLGSTPDYYYSSYGVRVALDLSGANFYQLGREKASLRSVRATLESAGQTLEANVTRQYLTVLRSRDAVELARAELGRAEANQKLADARYAVESATAIEAKQAAVERGRAEVGVLRAEATLDNQGVRLLELIGLDLAGEVELTSDVPIFEPEWSLETLLAAALASQPELAAARASTAAADAGVGIARSAFWPSLSLSTGTSGYTRRVGSDQFLLDQALQSERQECEFANALAALVEEISDELVQRQDCTAIQLSDSRRSSILAQNDQFPFDFVSEPLSVSLAVSLPIFQGLDRKRQLEASRAQADDARWQLRARELATRARVETSYRELTTAYEAVRLEERNLELARDQLRLARERYRLGAAAFLELMEAEALMARADREYLLGVYTFQEALTALEQAVGQNLAIPENRK